MRQLGPTAAIVAHFTALLVQLTAPFWLAAELYPVKLLPGLPVSALMAVCPTLAALTLMGKRARDRSLQTH